MDYISKQKIIIDQCVDNSVFILCSGDLSVRNGDSFYPFRVHSDFFYLTGLAEPRMCLILKKHHGQLTRILIILDPPLNKRLWDSAWQLTKQSSVLNEYDYVYSWEDTCALHDLAKNINEHMKLYHQGLSVDALTFFGAIPFAIDFMRNVIAELRLVKLSQEILLIEKACEYSSAVYTKIYETDRRLWTNEAVIEGFWVYEVKKRGALFQAYPPIIAGGERACCLHYQLNNHCLKKEGMVLIDAGFEYNHYASDITRMLFLKKPTSLQLELYQLLLTIQQEIIAMIKPGVTFAQLQRYTQEKMAQGLALLNIFPGSAEKILEKDLPYCYMHSVGHHLGLDVHDGQGLMLLKERAFAAGMVLTIEPGFYFSPMHFPDHLLSGVGMRIEDDILVQADGYRVLTTAPKQLVDVCHGL